MADFKLTIADPKTGKCYQKEVKDAEAAPFIGLNIGETIKGDGFGLAGYEFKITGGSDYCGFPMRSGILGIRKRVILYGGVGFAGKMRPLRKGKEKRKQFGLRKRRTVCGHKINENITQINLSVLKEGSKKLADSLGAKEGEKAEAKPGAKPKAEKPNEEKPKAEEKPETKEEQSSSKPQKSSISEKPKEEAKPKEEKPKEEKKEEAKPEAPKEAPKKEEKPAEK